MMKHAKSKNAQKRNTLYSIWHIKTTLINLINISIIQLVINSHSFVFNIRVWLVYKVPLAPLVPVASLWVYQKMRRKLYFLVMPLPLMSCPVLQGAIGEKGSKGNQVTGVWVGKILLLSLPTLASRNWHHLSVLIQGPIGPRGDSGPAGLPGPPVRLVWFVLAISKH